MSDKKYYVDPPSGWRYGFPKPYDFQKDGTMAEFLLKNGYPEKDIPFALNYMRGWEEHEEK